MNPPGQLITEALHTITLPIYTHMKEMNPPGQSSIEALCIVTLHLYVTEVSMDIAAIGTLPFPMEFLCFCGKIPSLLHL